MHNISIFVFWITIILYGATLATASYVGVYLTYVAIPLIVVSGIIAILSKPKNNRKSEKNIRPSLLSGIARSTVHALNETSGVLNKTSEALDSFNNRLDLRNIELDLKILRASVSELQREKEMSHANIKHEDEESERINDSAVISGIDIKIKEIESEIWILENKYELLSSVK